MDEIVKLECKKYTFQLFNWLKMRYPDYVYDYMVLEYENLVSIKIKMNITKKKYEKKGIGILHYIVKAFKYPQHIKINWRYNRNMFNIVVFCGETERISYMLHNENENI